jgi:hypothetical protein
LAAVVLAAVVLVVAGFAAAAFAVAARFESLDGDAIGARFLLVGAMVKMMNQKWMRLCEPTSMESARLVEK